MKALGRTRRAGRILAAVLALLAAAAPGRAAPEGRPPAIPEYSIGLDLPLLVWGLGGLVASQTIPIDVQPVPEEGFDPEGIRFDFDKEEVGDTGADAENWSDYLVTASIAFPVALRMATSKGARVSAPVHSALLTAESVLLADAVTQIIKRNQSRARPYTYLPESERPDDPAYDVTSERAFASFPSGHAASAWAAVACGLTDNLLARPNAGGVEQALTGFAGGLLASTTGTLRVEAGQHFRSDVIAGAAIGFTSGLTIPLLHRFVSGGDPAPRPSAAAWLHTAGGILAGAAAGLAVGEMIGG